MPEQLILVAIGIGCASVGALICYFPARAGNTTFSLAVLGLLAVALIGTLIKANQAIGWDALGWFLLALLFIGPGLVGGAIATLIARRRARKATQNQTQ